ncbi:DNA translocase FtsK [Halobacillus litoralis]|uniref:DNA translocase FtsK n=1 Tax=Halobacillus litoralis TaxID=45668 RepID=UPI0024913D29|nr:DNA translocase FtsK [Halobacillus litoralis]
MWKDLKNKMKQWFEPDENSAEQPLQKKEERHEVNAKTKMTYRYPKQGEFRFPVIPDQPNRNSEDGNEDTSQHEIRPPRRKKAAEELPKVERKQRRRPSRKQGDSQAQQLPETSSVPFTPTDVPSPIYGYQARQMTKGLEKLEYAVEEESKPGFFTDSNDEKQWQDLRKRLRARVQEGETASQNKTTAETPSVHEIAEDEMGNQEVHKEEAASIEVDTQAVDSQKTINETVYEHQKEETEELHTSPPVIETEDSVVEEADQEEIKGSNEADEETEPFDEEVTEENVEIEETPIPEEKETGREELHQEEEVEKPKRDEEPVQEDSTPVPSKSVEEPNKPKEKRSVPFNVLMTPRDKRTRDNQKDSIHRPPEKEQNQNKEPMSPTKEETSVPEKRVEYQTPLHLLEDPLRPNSDDDTWITQQMELLETTLRHFHVRAKVVNAMKGPTVTRFEVQPEPGVKVSKITNLSDDIKLSMAAKDIRIEAPIPGKQAVGIEVPNQQSQMVGLQEIFEADAFHSDNSPLSVGLGLDIGGGAIVTNLKKMPHGLIAGATGSGKSVCINTILISLLYKAHHEDVKFLLIDPKMVELAPYNDLPHLVSPVITDVKAATTALKWAVKEMEERYEKFVEEGVRDVEKYNDKMVKQNRTTEKMPYLVIVIDELADLMMVSPQDVEDAICRIAQKARACGIHLLLATQRPSVDVITGLIKANIPTRIAFSVSSQVDSRTIIDSGGAEKLLGKGDMLFVENGSGQPLRIQGAFVSDDEIERVTNYVKKIAPPQYLFHQEELMKQISTEEDTDVLFDEAVAFVVDQNGASASLIQRRFKVGYNRAARLIDQMEDFGIISEQKGSKPRDVLLTKQQIQELME